MLVLCNGPIIINHESDWVDDVEMKICESWSNVCNRNCYILQWCLFFSADWRAVATLDQCDWPGNLWNGTDIAVKSKFMTTIKRQKCPVFSPPPHTRNNWLWKIATLGISPHFIAAGYDHEVICWFIRSNGILIAPEGLHFSYLPLNIYINKPALSYITLGANGHCWPRCRANYIFHLFER